MPIPTPEEMQTILGLHPDQIAARQAMIDAAGGDTSQLPSYPGPLPSTDKSEWNNSGITPKQSLIPQQGPRALSVPRVGDQDEEEKPEPMPVRIFSPKIDSPKVDMPPVGSPGPVPGSVVAGVDSKGRPTLAPDQQHQLPIDQSAKPLTDEAAAPTAPTPRGLNVPPVGFQEPDTSTLHDLMTKPMQPAFSGNMRNIDGATQQQNSPATAATSSEGTAATQTRRPLDTSRYGRDRAILDSDTANGSGVDRFRQRHHIWGGLLKALNVAGSILAPGPMSMVPGTDLNHQVRIGQDRARVKNDLQDEATQANTAHVQAQAEALNNKPDASPKPVFDHAGDLIGFQAGENLLGPKSPKLTQDMRDMIAAAKGKTAAAGSPESQAMAFMVQGGMTPTEAYKKLQDMKADNKPDTAAQNKQQFQSVIGKLAAENGNKLQDGVLSSPQKTADAISNARTLTPQEKQFALSFIAANSTPANVIYAGAERGASYGATRQFPVLDTKNGNRPIYVSADELNRAQTQEPGRYLASSAGEKALNKENLMEDIRGGIQQVRDALNDKDMPEFTKWQSTKIAVAMRESDPRSVVSSLIANGDLGSMTPAQENYLIAHSILAEQAMAMRTVLGAGQGSQDLRAAITKTFPGPSTPSKAYALKQLEAFEKTIDRLERGIPNVPLKDQRNGGSNNQPPPAPQGMISVQIPGQPVGHIPASARKQFLQDNPGAKVIE